METEGMKKEGPCTFILHIPVSLQSEISHAIPWKHESSHQHNHREPLHSCTGSIEFGRHMPLAKATPTLCCVSVVVMPTESVLAWQHYAYSFWKNWFPSLETLLLFRRIFLWGEVNTPYVSWCFSSWPLLLAWNVKITSNAGNQKSIRMHI